MNRIKVGRRLERGAITGIRSVDFAQNMGDRSFDARLREAAEEMRREKRTPEIRQLVRVR